MNIKTKEGARNKGNPYFLRVPWNKGGLVNTGPDPQLFRSVFLLAFFRFLRMSNIAPHPVSAFDYSKLLNQQDVIFGPPGAHVIIKW